MTHIFSAKQDKLSAKDLDDERIPLGGTPAFNIISLGTDYLWQNVRFSLEVENIFDELYRNHASALNGAGRSLNFYLNYSL
jgi:outer membrane receptor protein involved in Fe transport